MSSIADQIKLYKPRTLHNPPGRVTSFSKSKKSNNPNPAHESLAMKCVRQIVDSFEILPAGENVPSKYIQEITSRLPLDLKPKVAGTVLFIFIVLITSLR